VGTHFIPFSILLQTHTFGEKKRKKTLEESHRRQERTERVNGLKEIHNRKWKEKNTISFDTKGELGAFKGKS
jgi:hypothetical protein